MLELKRRHRSRGKKRSSIHRTPKGFRGATVGKRRLSGM